jgi:radical S-adenosyl methionine domain-containing protein 2
LDVTYEKSPAGQKERAEESNSSHCLFKKSFVQNYAYAIRRIRSVNWHITARCNYRCKFCFSQKLNGELTSIVEAKEILTYLRSMGMEKINFVGGEPTLHPLFFEFVRFAKELDFVVSVVSNGYYLTRDIILDLKPFVDWIGLSIDSADEEVEVVLGRGKGGHVKRVLELSEMVREARIKLKINTTVTKLNWFEDMRPLIRRLKPDRWKVFQVLHISGQNDQYFGELSITEDQFSYFKSLNQGCIKGVAVVFEGNHEMIGSYFMLSPSGMVMSNLDGTNRTLKCLANIDRESLSQILNVKQYLGRGGIYSW